MSRQHWPQGNRRGAAILDTNVIISGLLSPGGNASSADDRTWIARHGKGQEDGPFKLTTLTTPNHPSPAARVLHIIDTSQCQMTTTRAFLRVWREGDRSHSVLADHNDIDQRVDLSGSCSCAAPQRQTNDANHQRVFCKDAHVIRICCQSGRPGGSLTFASH